MTLVDLDALETALGLPEPLLDGLVTVTYWAGRRPFVNVEGADVIFPTPIRVRIVDGEPVTPMDLDPTGTVCCVKWVVSSVTGSTVTRYTTVPDSGPVSFGDLPVVNPVTFTPITPTQTLRDLITEIVIELARDRF